MKHRFTKEQCDSFLELIKIYDVDQYASRKLKAFLNAQLLIQQRHLSTCPECDLNPYNVEEHIPCKTCGMIGKVSK